MRVHRVFFVIAALFILVNVAFAQTNASQGYPRDWSNSHVIFTNGGNATQRAAAQQDPRLLHNWFYRNSMLVQRRPGPDTLAAPEARQLDLASRFRNASINLRKQKNSDIDWAISLGNAAGMKQGVFPAKYTFDYTQPSCANDFIVYVIGGTPGVGSHANIIALNNLYTGTTSSSCPNGPQTPPTTNLTSATFMWSYALGNAAINLSPVLSLDGKQVAVVTNNNPAILHVLTPVAGQGTNATTGAVAVGSGSVDQTLSYTNITTAGCTASPSVNTGSAPYVDYVHNYIYVGADNGVLYRIKNVFGSTPALDYCITVSAGRKLTAPILDFASGKVFVSDGRSVFGFTPGATSFTAAGSIQVGFNFTSISLAPTVDSTNGFMYVFSSRNTANTGAIVSQIPTTLASKIDARIGPATASVLLDGTFDNAYFMNGPAAGTMYACGTQATSGTRPSLYAIGFAANGQMNTTLAMSDNRRINAAAGNGPAGVCSPITEYFDGTHDRMFVGTGNATGTGGANLVTMWVIDSRLTATSTPTASATNEIGGVSGISVDNDSTIPQASSIYFGTLFHSNAAPCGNNYCAVKLTQGALQ